MTREEREAHVRSVVDSAPAPECQDIDRLRALLQLHVRAVPAVTRPTAPGRRKYAQKAA